MAGCFIAQLREAPKKLGDLERRTGEVQGLGFRV